MKKWTALAFYIAFNAGAAIAGEKFPCESVVNPLLKSLGFGTFLKPESHIKKVTTNDGSSRFSSSNGASIILNPQGVTLLNSIAGTTISLSLAFDSACIVNKASSNSMGPWSHMYVSVDAAECKRLKTLSAVHATIANIPGVLPMSFAQTAGQGLCNAYFKSNAQEPVQTIESKGPAVDGAQ